MSKITIIYGEENTGKTTFAKKLTNHFNSVLKYELKGAAVVRVDMRHKIPDCVLIEGWKVELVGLEANFRPFLFERRGKDSLYVMNPFVICVCNTNQMNLQYMRPEFEDKYCFVKCEVIDNKYIHTYKTISDVLSEITKNQ